MSETDILRNIHKGLAGITIGNSAFNSFMLIQRLLTFLVFILSGVCVKCQIQNSLLSTIAKDATTIKVYGVGYRELCLALLDSNYTFERRDEDLQTFKTVMRDHKKYWDCSYSIEGRFKDSVAFLKFRLKDSPLLFKYARWQRTKKKYHEKSLYNYPFIEI